MAQNFRQITNEAVLQKPYINEFDAKNCGIRWFVNEAEGAYS